MNDALERFEADPIKNKEDIEVKKEELMRTRKYFLVMLSTFAA